LAPALRGLPLVILGRQARNGKLLPFACRLALRPRIEVGHQFLDGFGVNRTLHPIRAALGGSLRRNEVLAFNRLREIADDVGIGELLAGRQVRLTANRLKTLRDIDAPPAFGLNAGPALRESA